MEKLRKELNKLIGRLNNSRDLLIELESLVSIYPFSEYEYIISHLLAAKKLSIDKYKELRNSYLDRNLYLTLFEISAPRGFGDKWAFGHLKELIPEFQRPNKVLDKSFSGEYDFLLKWSDKGKKSHKIRIEIKASRAVDFHRPDEPLYIKALSAASKKPFDMNFQQIKIKCADVFVWVGVWRDKIRYWVLNSNDIKGNKYFSKGQHRGNVGEGQLHINQDNIADFDQYEFSSIKIKNAVVNAFKKLMKI